MLDCVVVGGGPAGLTAAIYLARFRRDFRLVDAGDSRARWIPLARNYPGFPAGVSGVDLLALMTDQARAYGAEIVRDRVTALRRGGDAFVLDLEAGGALESRTVILATGVVETLPPLPNVLDAITAGLLRFCPICDGFETAGRTVGVLGDGEHAAAEALFIRTYSDAVSLILVGEAAALPEDRRRALAEAGIDVIETPIEAIRLTENEARALCLDDGSERRFEALYSALGVTAQSALARSVGAKTDPDGRLVVDEHRETSVEGLFAVGDLVRGLNQIGVAVGEAALAATAIHNRLRG